VAEYLVLPVPDPVAVAVAVAERLVLPVPDHDAVARRLVLSVTGPGPVSVAGRLVLSVPFAVAGRLVLRVPVAVAERSVLPVPDPVAGRLVPGLAAVPPGLLSGSADPNVAAAFPATYEKASCACFNTAREHEEKRIA
jgi:hypothetical protein